MAIGYDGWVTPDGKFLPEEFSHKETLQKHGFNYESDQAMKQEFLRLSDNGTSLTAEVWFTKAIWAKEWLQNNIPDREIVLEVFGNSNIPRTFRIDGML